MKWSPAEEITVDIALERVTFRDADTAPIEWLPVVYVDVSGRRVKVVSVGQPPADGAPAVRVELFAPDHPPAGISKLDCLAAFFTAGIKDLVDRHLFRIRPDVRVYGADRISERFSGYERDLFAHALERAGAKRVRWPEDAQRE